MVLRCFLCKTTYKNNKRDIQLHRFPQKEHILKLWLSVLNVEQINRNAKLCSKHFTEEDFKISLVGERKYLKPNAVPSVNLQKEEKNVGFNSSKKEIIQNRQDVSLKRSLLTDQSAEEEVPLKNIRTITNIDIKKVSQSSLEAEACLEVLVEELKEKQKEVKQFKNKVCKLQKTVKDLRSLMKTLKEKKLITSTAIDTLKLIESPALVTIVQKILSSKHKFATFPPELKTFATILHFYSPKAYNFIRRTFMNILPHLSAMRKWYYSIDGSPGILQHALDCLTKKAREAVKKKRTILCGLQIDDMSIRKHIDFNGKEYIGFINFGTQLNSDELPLTKEVVVIMAVAINEHWKIPIAYYFIDTLTAKDRTNIIMNVLKSIHETGIDIISLTFDGPYYNFAMANILEIYFQNPLRASVANHI